MTLKTRRDFLRAAAHAGALCCAPAYLSMGHPEKVSPENLKAYLELIYTELMNEKPLTPQSFKNFRLTFTVTDAEGNERWVNNWKDYQAWKSGKLKRSGPLEAEARAALERIYSENHQQR